MVGMVTFRCVGLEYRRSSLFDLQEQRVGIRCHQEHDSAEGSNATDPNYFEREVHQLETIEQFTAIFLERFAISFKTSQDIFPLRMVPLIRPMED